MIGGGNRCVIPLVELSIYDANAGTKIWGVILLSRICWVSSDIDFGIEANPILGRNGES
jgi:hypothetical protein